MTTATQYWSIASGPMFLGDGGSVHFMNDDQNDPQYMRVAEAFALWDDVSGFHPMEVDDNVDVARGATTTVPDGFLGRITGERVWQTPLPNDYSRIALADIRGSTLGFNAHQWADPSEGPLDPHTTPGDDLYHEIYIDTAAEGIATFELGSTAFHSLVHEIGHSVLGKLDPANGVEATEDRKHIVDTDAMMTPYTRNDPSIWHSSTPMTLDIDYTSSIYGRATQTRLGDDTYGFNAFFSDDNYRAALDFSVNTRPLVTIFDNGGENDTLDASGFFSYTSMGGQPRAVKIDLNPGAESTIINGQTFAVIYKSTIWNTETWIENAVGGYANDELYGNIKANTLIGNAGDDILDGRGGVDIMIGGADNDTYHVDDAADEVRELLLIDARTGETRQDGVDKVIASVDYWLRDNVENMDLTGDAILGIGNRIDNVITGNGAENLLYGMRGNDTLDGREGADTMFGGADSDTYYVDNAGDQVIENAQEYDPDSRRWLDGGIDRIISSIDFTNPLPENVENLELTGAAITGTGNDLGNVIIGNDQDNRLYGNGGADTFIGGIGADYMAGGTGDDIYYVDNPGDDIYEYSRPFGSHRHLSGIDLVYSNTADYTLSNQVENMTLLIDGVNGTGNALANEIIGNQASNTLRGLDGADTLDGGIGTDTLEGGAGNDILKGGADADTMKGGDDDDTYYVDSIRDKVVEGSGARSGTDLVYSTASTHTLAANVENLILLDGAFNGTGNGLVNIITGNEQVNTLKGMGGADTLEGNGGADVLDGGTGNDILRGGEGADTLRGGADSDRADYSLAMDSVVVDLAKGGIGGEAAGDTYESIEGVIGSEYADIIRGSDGADVIMGLGDGDIIEGRGGNDTLTGGDADYANTFVFTRGWGKDTITDFKVGMDHLDMTGVTGLSGLGQLTITNTAQGAKITLGADTITLNGVTKAQLLASDSFTFDKPVLGTEGKDVLTGDGAANHLMGLGGDDTLIGKGGADLLDGGTGVDTVDYSLSSAAVTVDLAKGIGQGGDAAGDTFVGIEQAIGSAFGDTFRGGTDRGQFLAGDGNDTMIGGSWFDWFEGGNGNDTFIGTGGQMVMLAGDGDDTMTGSLDNSNYFDGGTGNDVMVGGNLGDYIADMTGGDDTMHGGAGDDTLDDFYGLTQLFGEDGDDFVSAAGGTGLLDGGAGKDYISVANGNYTLVGGAGDDTLEAAGTGAHIFTGGAGADTFTYRVGGDQMRIVTDFQDGVDHIYLWDNHYYGNVPLESLMIADSAAGAVISWNGASQMVLTGIAASQLTHDDFVV